MYRRFSCCRFFKHFSGIEEKSHEMKVVGFISGDFFNTWKDCIVHLLVQFSSRWYLCALNRPCALHQAVSQKFPQRCLWNGFNLRLIDDGPLSPFWERSSSASSFHASLLQAIDGVTSLALCPRVVSQVPQHFKSSETQTSRDSCFAGSRSARSVV